MNKEEKDKLLEVLQSSAKEAITKIKKYELTRDFINFRVKSAFNELGYGDYYLSGYTYFLAEIISEFFREGGVSTDIKNYQKNISRRISEFVEKL